MTLPDFNFSAFYYPEVLAALIALKSRAWPEHTETDPHDPVIQLLRLYAVLGHLQASRLDHVAREVYLPTLRLRSSMVALCALIDYQLAPPSAAVVEVVADLSGPAAPAATVIRAGSLAATSGGVVFERTDAVITSDGTGTYPYFLYDADDTASAPTAPGFPSGALAIGAGDHAALYFGHPDLMFDRIGIVLVSGVTTPKTLRWEYYDETRILAPDTVTDLGGSVRFRVDTCVGAGNSSGLEVIVTCTRTGVSASGRTVQASGQQRVTITGTLGQSTVSTRPGDYLVQTWWPALEAVADGSSGMTVSGAVRWTLPQTTQRRWAPGTVAGVTAYWVRARWSDTLAGSESVNVDTPTQPPGAVWSVLWEATQGRTVQDRIGVTDGSASQTLPLTRTPFMSLNSVTVDGGSWTQVENFLSSSPFDKVFTLTEDPDGTRRVTFGDGETGAIPPNGVQVVATYRIGGDVSGNVGPLAIAQDRSANRIGNVRNPRAGAGWTELEGSTEESLSRTRIAAPASLRALGRAVTPDDCAALAQVFRDADGAAVAIRAAAIEEGAGPKTVQLLLVGTGGTAPTPAQRAEVEAYFNGETIGLQRVGGVAPANTTIQADAFVGVPIDVTATVEVLATYSAGASARIEAALTAALAPDARALVLDETGVWVESQDYRWPFGGTVSRAQLVTAIVTAIAGVANVTLTDPAADVPLNPDELPIPGTINVSVTVIG